MCVCVCACQGHTAIRFEVVRLNSIVQSQQAACSVIICSRQVQYWQLIMDVPRLISLPLPNLLQL